MRARYRAVGSIQTGGATVNDVVRGELPSTAGQGSAPAESEIVDWTAGVVVSVGGGTVDPVDPEAGSVDPEAASVDLDPSGASPESRGASEVGAPADCAANESGTLVSVGAPAGSPSALRTVSLPPTKKAATAAANMATPVKAAVVSAVRRADDAVLRSADSIPPRYPSIEQSNGHSAVPLLQLESQVRLRGQLLCWPSAPRP